MIYTATYSPDDNKLRLSASARLSAEEYARVKAAGFRWAPKQECFYSTWSPDAANLCEELAGEIEDDDKTLAERAEERADRFEDYHDSRSKEAEQAHKAVAGIMEGIPMGQPILIGHHSERHARKDQQRIENGMRKAVKAFETAEYWTRRAAGALRHAQYKERPDVRARRIKTLEADLRKMERSKAKNERALRVYTNPEAAEAILPDGRNFVAAYLGTYESGLTYEQQRAFDKEELSRADAIKTASANLSRMLAWCMRWIEHYQFRLTYERAMLQETGGTVADRKPLEVGGAVKCLWAPRGGWAYIKKVNRVSVTIRQQYNPGGRTFPHNEPLDKIHGIMTRAEVEQARAEGRIQEAEQELGFWLMQSREEFDRDNPENTDKPSAPAPQPEEKPAIKPVEQLKAALAAGVQVVSAPQLFPTPRDLAQRMADMADIQPGHAVLEPSAGTGMLLGAMGGRMFGHNPERGRVAAVEIVPELARRLKQEFPLTLVRCEDFLECVFESGFDRIIMNPPFKDGADIKHIKHAAGMLAPGGRLVALCANGPRQQAALKEWAEESGGTWEPLPAGTFAEAGTGVNVALLVFEAKEEGSPEERLRATWAAQGVSQERQAEMLEQIEAKGKAGISFVPKPEPMKPINRGQMALI